MIEATVRQLIRLFREHVQQNTVLSAGSIVEISELPAIILNGPILTEKLRLMHDSDRITAIDEDSGVAVREVPPRWFDLKFDVNFSCLSNLELIALFGTCSRVSQAFPLLDADNSERRRKYLWRWTSSPQASITPNISQVYHGRGEITIYDVEVYSNIQEVWPLIEKVKIDIEKDKIEVQL